MVTLGGVELSGSLLWVDKDSYSTVEQSARRTLGGTLVLFSRSIVAGRPITLEATEETGWVTRSMVDELHAMASRPGEVYNLTYHEFVCSVVFRHEEPPAVSFNPLTPKAVPLGTDYYVGQIKLLTVY